MTTDAAQVYESLISEIATLDRPAMLAKLLHFDGPLPLDFTESYLLPKSTEELRHLLLAALWRCRTKKAS